LRDSWKGFGWETQRVWLRSSIGLVEKLGLRSSKGLVEMQAWVEKAQIDLDKPKRVLSVLMQEEAWSYDSSSALLLLLEELARTSAILLMTKKKESAEGFKGRRQTNLHGENVQLISAACDTDPLTGCWIWMSPILQAPTRVM
jgi:hypothetical protein